MQLGLLRPYFSSWLGGQWYSYPINWLSGNNGYWHSDLVFSDDYSFTSTISKGVILVPKAERKYQLEYWDFFDIIITPEQEAQVRKNAESIVGSPYDYLGVARWIIPFVGQSKTRYFCSESNVEVFNENPPNMLNNLEPYRVNPNHMLPIFRTNGLIAGGQKAVANMYGSWWKAGMKNKAA